MIEPIVLGGLVLHQLLLDLGRFELVDRGLLLQFRAFQLDMQHPQLDLVLALGGLEDPHSPLKRLLSVGGRRAVPADGDGRHRVAFRRLKSKTIPWYRYAVGEHAEKLRGKGGRKGGTIPSSTRRDVDTGLSGQAALFSATSAASPSAAILRRFGDEKSSSNFCDKSP